MKRSAFYKVEPDQYLFPAISRCEDSRMRIEEPVRQWAAYELIRCYGVLPSNLEFEHQVKVGSKLYKIDILVCNKGRPVAVIECKEPNFARHAQGMQQAISYADAQEIRAEYAVYTNGDAWQVMRRIQERWVMIADLPQTLDQSGAIPINRLLHSFQNICRVLSDIDEALSGDRAGKFLNDLQVLYHGRKLLMPDSSGDLLNAADNLLRVLTKPDDPIYQFGKFNTAAASLEQYRKSAGFNLEFLPADGHSPLAAAFKEMYATISFMVEDSGEIAAPDALLLRVISAIAHYGQDIERLGDDHPPLPGSLRDAVRKHIEHGLLSQLNVSLPDPIDRYEIEDLKNYCRHFKGARKETGCSWLSGLKITLIAAIKLLFGRRH